MFKLDNIKRTFAGLLPLSIIALALLFILYLIFFRPSSEPVTIAEKAWPVATQAAKIQTHTPQVILLGRTESPRTSSLEATINAYVSEIKVDEGDRVKKGELLIKLDPSDVTLVLQQRKADVKDFNAQIKAEFVRQKTDTASLAFEKRLVELAKRNVERQDTLRKKKLGSELAYDDAVKTYQEQRLKVENRQQAVTDHTNRLQQLKAKLTRAEALLDQAKLDLKRTEIRAPFDGRITKLNVSIRDRVQVGEALINLYATDRVEFRAQIPSQYVSRARQAVNQNLVLTARTALDGATLGLKLDRIAGESAEGRGGVDGLFSVTKGAEHLVLGRTSTVYLDLRAAKNSIAIPTSALYGFNKIFVVENERLKALRVERLGIEYLPSGKQRYIIKSDKLKPNMPIVITQLPNARDGLRVLIVKETQEDGSQ